MAKITQIRGALLEEAVLYLLRKVGYEIYEPAALPNLLDNMRMGHSGLEVRGRGTWHQLDAFAVWTHSPAFMYPLQLMVEAKCYAASRPVGVEVARNSVGVLKDISENYFTFNRRGDAFRGPRFNNTAAIFSTSGFTQGAVEYSVAHQVFLIQYENVPAIQPLINAIMQFDEECVEGRGKGVIAAARGFLRRILRQDQGPYVFGRELRGGNHLTRAGEDLLSESVAPAVEAIRGSYFGMLQGMWPLHLLRREPLPAAAFESDVVRCRVKRNEQGEWSFVPSNIPAEDPRWFRLEFSLPAAIAEIVDLNRNDPLAIADLKQANFSYIDVSGLIGGIRRNVRLQLDRAWINRYIESLRR